MTLNYTVISKRKRYLYMERLSDYHFNQVIKLSIDNRKVHVYMLSHFSHV